MRSFLFSVGLLGALVSSCAYRQVRAPTNVVDYLAMTKYSSRTRLGLLATKPSSASLPARSAALSFRRKFDNVVYSRCKWLPSDSEFYERTSKSCGSLRAAVFALGRSLEEPDIDLDPEHPVMYYQGRLRWAHMPLECIP